MSEVGLAGRANPPASGHSQDPGASSCGCPGRYRASNTIPSHVDGGGVPSHLDGADSIEWRVEKLSNRNHAWITRGPGVTHESIPLVGRGPHPQTSSLEVCGCGPHEPAL